jgi:hypothetical protein
VEVLMRLHGDLSAVIAAATTEPDAGAGA